MTSAVAAGPASAATVGAAFHPDDLASNRDGRLTGRQRQAYGALDRDWRKGTLGLAGVFAVIGLLVISATGPAPNAAMRPLAGIAFLALAAGTVLWSLPGRDPLARDLRAARVESYEGAISRDQILTPSTHSSGASYFLDVGDRRFSVYRDEYHAAPDAGWVRVYYLPRSHRIVNLERLPDKPLPAGALDNPMETVKEVMHGWASTRGAQRREAMAEMQALGGAMRVEMREAAVPPPPGQRDPRPLAQAILGSWRTGFVSVTFAPDGTLQAHMGGRDVPGRWSVSGDDGLRADMMGREQAGHAWVVGDTLTLVVNGEGTTFQRTGGS